MTNKGPTICLLMTIALVFVFLATPGWAKGMVTYSFDDGLANVYADALPILKKHHQKATVGIVYDRVISGNDDYLSVSQVMEMQNNGWEVASHGLTHKRPTEIPQYLYQESISAWVEDKPLSWCL